MITSATNTVKDKAEFLNSYLKDKKYESVIDVGGVMYPFARKYVHAYLDIHDIHTYGLGPELYDDDLKRSKSFVGDICKESGWISLMTHIAMHRGGKLFDFAICSHTLEDIRNPVAPIEMLPKIAKEGVIIVPSKYTELCMGIETSTPHDRAATGTIVNYRGYMHHRWIFTVPFKGHMILTLFPKLNFVDAMAGIDEWATRDMKDYYGDLVVFWEDDIPYKIINNDFLGPNPPSVVGMYAENLREGL